MTTPRPASGEFDLIRRHFQRMDTQRTGNPSAGNPSAGNPSAGSPLPPGVALGIGDDCALLVPEPGHQLAVSTDMLVEGRHFLPGADPAALGHKALAVNLSDLAAMGARPLGFTLALALPRANDTWLAAFASGLFALADQHACPLVGGDTTRGPLNLCITVFGQLAPGAALRRSAARPGDDIYLSGRTGEARLALALHPELQRRLDQPTPRLVLGCALAGVAHAAIDVSDGLAADLGHILTASGVGAALDLAALPLAPALQTLPPERRLDCLLNGGDDYELVFTAAQEQRAAVAAAAQASATPVSRIGRTTAEPGLVAVHANGSRHAIEARGFDHFG